MSKETENKCPVMHGSLASNSSTGTSNIHIHYSLLLLLGAWKSLNWRLEVQSLIVIKYLVFTEINSKHEVVMTSPDEES